MDRSIIHLFLRPLRCSIPIHPRCRRARFAGDDPVPADVDPFPQWFSQFLNDRQTRKPSAHTMRAYGQDFIAIAMLVTNGHPARLTVTDITKDSMRTAFAAYAQDHEAASIRRCWSTWNVLCTFLYTRELLAANPMQLVGRPKLAQPLPKALPRSAVEAAGGGTGDRSGGDAPAVRSTRRSRSATR
jgi:integrase/recombinase XerC